MKEYTAAELQEVGRKTIESQRKRSEQEREDRSIMRELLKAYREGRIPKSILK
jgi:hypothetical protein